MAVTKHFFEKFDYEEFNRQNLLKIVSRFGSPKNLKILYISTYIRNYTRTETLLTLFAKSGLQVKTVLTGGCWLKYILALRGLLRYQSEYDLIFVGFRGHEILPILRVITRKPIVFDAFVSVYDTLCFDRRLFKPSSLIGKFLRWYDKYLCKISQVTLVDTKAHKDYFEKEFKADNVDYIYLDCNKSIFCPLAIKQNKPHFVVFWYGSANPLQGVDVILRAAKLLERETVRFRLIGAVRKKYGRLLRELNMSNVEMMDFVPYEQLPLEINRADICLGGHFSDRAKGRRTISGKTFQFLACEKPTIIGDNCANRELFKSGGLIQYVKMFDPEDLAEKIMKLRSKISERFIDKT
jgi:glycosyltransferase involved in cell wall biosynthesis